jgi:acyl carrier protein
MDRQVILQHVRQSIADSCGIPEERIEASATLFQDLGITSIDLVDILFTLESTFDVELKISDIERRSRRELGDAPFEVNGAISPEGRAVLGRLLPEIPAEKLRETLTLHDIVNLITVDVLCTMVQHKLSEREELAHGPA